MSFEGPPDAVGGLRPDRPRNGAAKVRVSIASDDGWTPVRALTAPAGEQTLVRLVLPPNTPATETRRRGRGRRRAVRGCGPDVAYTQLDSSPAALDLAVEDSTATATVQRRQRRQRRRRSPRHLGVRTHDGRRRRDRDRSGLMTADTGVDRIGRFADALAERHGGLARVMIESGAGRLEPGRSTTVTARIRLGDGGRRRQALPRCLAARHPADPGVAPRRGAPDRPEEAEPDEEGSLHMSGIDDLHDARRRASTPPVSSATARSRSITGLRRPGRRRRQGAGRARRVDGSCAVRATTHVLDADELPPITSAVCPGATARIRFLVRNCGLADRKVFVAATGPDAPSGHRRTVDGDDRGARDR